MNKPLCLLIALIAPPILVQSAARALEPPPSAAKPSPQPAPSAPCPCSEGESGDRTLKGATFPFPLRQDTAFVTTHFGIRQGFEFVNIPSVPVGEAGTISLTATGLTQFFDLGVKLYSSKAPWFGQFGLYGVGGGRINLGASAASIILAENSFTASGQVGGVVRILRLEDTGTQIALRGFGGGSTGRKIDLQTMLDRLEANPEGGVKDIIRGKAQKYLLTPTSTKTFGVSLHGAQAVAPFLSLQLALGLTVFKDTAQSFDPSSGARADNTSSTNQVSLGAAVTFDANSLGVPLAIVPEYTMVRTSTTVDKTGESGSAIENFVAAGLYYSGRRDLQLGVAVETQLGLKPVSGIDANGDPAPSAKPSAIATQFILRYIW